MFLACKTVKFDSVFIAKAWNVVCCVYKHNHMVRVSESFHEVLMLLVIVMNGAHRREILEYFK